MGLYRNLSRILQRLDVVKQICFWETSWVRRDSNKPARKDFKRDHLGWWRRFWTEKENSIQEKLYWYRWGFAINGYFAWILKLHTAWNGILWSRLEYSKSWSVTHDQITATITACWATTARLKNCTGTVYKLIFQQIKSIISFEGMINFYNDNRNLQFSKEHLALQIQ